MRFLALTIFALQTAQAQGGWIPRWSDPKWVGSFDDEDRREAQLLGTQPVAALLVRPLVRRVSDSTPRITLFNPSGRLTYNSDVPYGFNDGPMWAGRGTSVSADFGAEVHWGVLSARLAPTVTWSQNANFRIAPLFQPPSNARQTSDQFWSKWIDRPQRFGGGSIERLDAGQSMVRLDWRALAIGAGTESMWWGSGVRNSLLMTNNAGGFPHSFIGTGRPVDVGIGDVEAMYLVARLQDSDYWRLGEQPGRNKRWLGALVGTFNPRGAPGLYLGGGRVFYEYVPAGGLTLKDVLNVLQPFQKKKLRTPTNETGDDVADQLLSLFVRWVFPSVGFEVYGEWGRNDHAVDFRDFIGEPDHASAFMFGFGKVFPNRRGTLRIAGEMTALASGRTIALRTVPTWYAHGVVNQGYTQRGQVIGAGVGPGSDVQWFLAEWRSRGRWAAGAFVDRLRNDSDGFYAKYAPEGPRMLNFHRHDVTLSIGARGEVDLRRVRLDAELSRGDQRNRYTELGNDVKNMHLTVRSTVRFP